MTRTEKLLLTLIVLIVAFMAYLTYLNRQRFVENIKALMSKFKEEEVIVPYDKTVNHVDYVFDTVQDTKNFRPHNIDELKSIYYTALNNGWDEFSFYCPNDYESCVEDVKTIANRNEYLSLINNYVHPYNEYNKYNTLLVNDKEIHLKIDKLYSEDEVSKIDEKIDEIFNELGVSNISDKNVTVKKIHNYIINNTKYDADYKKGDATVSNKASGALFNKIALCSGYSDLFSIMLYRLDIPNFRVSNEEHIWNVIKIDNKWLHVDVTWDDDERNKNNIYNFYLINTKDLLEKDSDIHHFVIDDYLELK